LRRGCQGLVLCAAALSIAAPAEARGRPKAFPGHNPAISGIGRVAPAAPAPVAAPAPRIRFTNDSIIREDGSPGDRRSVVGSMPLVGPLAAEVGLFSVTGATPKEREPKRGDLITDVQPRRSRVAAVGLRLSF
jgi:hypothetical protein